MASFGLARLARSKSDAAVTRSPFWYAETPCAIRFAPPPRLASHHAALAKSTSAITPRIVGSSHRGRAGRIIGSRPGAGGVMGAATGGFIAACLDAAAPCGLYGLGALSDEGPASI